MSLRCEEVRNRFSALWENELSPPEQAEVKSHLEVCPECQKEFARFDKTLRMLHAVEEVGVPEGFLSGIYEKIEDRKRKDLPSVWTLWRRVHVPLRLKLPIQALAMVTIVFLALYLTKMMPGDFTRMKGAGEPKSSLLEGKRGPGDTKAQMPEEKRLDQVPQHNPTGKTEKRDVSGSLKDQARTEKAEGESKVVGAETPEASPPGAAKEERAFEPAMPTTEANKMDQGLAHPSAPSPALRPKEAEAPQAATPLEKTGDASRVKEAFSPWPEPSQEFVLKITDQEKTVSHVREIVKQFGGETLDRETNRLLVSLPNSSLAEFRKELEKVSSLSKTQQQETSRAAEGALAPSAGKGREAEEKNKKSGLPEASKDGQTLIRIVLIEE